jgi:hypothetical protein
LLTLCASVVKFSHPVLDVAHFIECHAEELR